MTPTMPAAPTGPVTPASVASHDSVASPAAPGSALRGDPRIPEPAAVDWHLGSLMIWHVLGDETGGLMSLGEVVVPRGCEPPMHVHAREDETWFVLEGAVLFQRGHERLSAGAGTAVVLPRGIPHGFAVQSATARMVHMYTPAGIEQAFREASSPAPRRELPPAPVGPPDPSLLAQVARAYERRGVTFVGPPLGVLLAGETAVGDAPTR